MSNCKFDQGGGCAILEEMLCKKGKPCKFAQSAMEYEALNDSRILRCRELELCDRCPYTLRPCKLSSEGRRRNAFLSADAAPAC